MIRLKVKELVQAKQISQGKLSHIADIDIKTARRIFRNPFEIITTETLDKIATALAVDVCELIEQVPGNAKLDENA